MTYPLLDSEEWVACEPIFLETADGFLLSAAAQAALAAMDPAPLSVIDRVTALRGEAQALAGLLPGSVRSMSAHELIDVLEAVQETTNMLSSVDQAVVARIDVEPDLDRWGHTSTAALLSDRLRVRPAEAKRRVKAARACTERTSLTGEVSPPLRPLVASAQASGVITADHAQVIVQALTWLPSDLPVEVVDDVERSLVELAGKRNPTDVAAAGRAARDTFDPDGPEPRDREQRRRRGLTLTQVDDGPGKLTGDLTAELYAKLHAVLSPLAAPQPDDANGPDERSYPQRLHDALEDVCDRLLRSDTLPDSGGVPATVAVVITLQQLEERTGRVSTLHGGDLSVEQLLHVACEADVIPVVVNDAGGILSHGRTRRFATPGQTKALWARDRGCSFPWCTRPPQWTQRHHVEEWIRDHGETDIGKMALLCSYHHHHFQQWGWRMLMIDGMPWWIPPVDIDPDQKPLQNTAH